MTKFHINGKGLPAPCHANQNNCPLGGQESHFDSLEDARKAISLQSEIENGLLPSISSASESPIYIRPLASEMISKAKVESSLVYVSKLSSAKRDLLDIEFSILEEHRMNPKSNKEKNKEKLEANLDKLGALGDNLREPMYKRAMNRMRSLFNSPVLINEIVNETINDDSRPMYSHIASKSEILDRKNKLNPIIEQATGELVNSDKTVSTNEYFKGISDSLSESKISNLMKLDSIRSDSERLEAKRLLREHVSNANKISMREPSGKLDKSNSAYKTICKRLVDAKSKSEDSSEGKKLRDECNYMLYSTGLSEDPYLKDSKGRPKAYYEVDQFAKMKEVFEKNYELFNDTEDDINVYYETDTQFNNRIQSTEKPFIDYLKSINQINN